jgi:predicted DNA-binding transcriptional regulator YafY
MNGAREVRRSRGAHRVELTAALARLPQTTLDAIWLGALLTVRLGDGALAAEAQEMLAALERLRVDTIDAEVITYQPEPAHGAAANAVGPMLDVAALRHALKHELKLKIGYTDAKDRETRRTVWPLDVEDYGPNRAMLCWCEKRGDFRDVRVDRVTSLAVLPARTDAPRGVFRAPFRATLPVDMP